MDGQKFLNLPGLPRAGRSIGTFGLCMVMGFAQQVLVVEVVQSLALVTALNENEPAGVRVARTRRCLAPAARSHPDRLTVVCRENSFGFDILILYTF